MPTDPTITRLDRRAAALGIALRPISTHVREFDAPSLGRTFRYRPGGSGAVWVGAFAGGTLDAEMVCGPERVERLFAQAAPAEANR